MPPRRSQEDEGGRRRKLHGVARSGERGNCRKDKVSRSFLKEVDFGCCCCAKGGGAVFFGKWRGGRQKGQLPNDLWRLLQKGREGRGKLDVAAAVRHRLDKENNP